MERITRRGFLGEAALALTALSLTPNRVFAPIHQSTIFEVFGLHDTPLVGGSIDVNLAMEDYTSLAARWIVALEPNSDFLKEARQRQFSLVTRAYLPNNVFVSDHLEQLVTNTVTYFPGPIIQPFNEVNRLVETGGIARSPEQHIQEDFIPAANMTGENNGLTLLTPLDPRAETLLPDGSINSQEYLTRMLKELKKAKGAKWIAEHIGIGIHPYIFKLDDNPTQQIMETHQLVKAELGLSTAIFAPESGLHLTRKSTFTEAQIAEITSRILQTKIPIGPKLAMYAFWLSSNLAQRPKNEKLGNEQEMADFEAAAWRTKAGPRLVYQKVQNLAANFI